MDVRDINILEVGLMNTNEARELFKSQAGSRVIGGKYKNVVERLLNKCGGLPLAIVATANSLKDKDLSCWENFADDLEKPISSQISGDYRYTFSILNTSYKFIQPDGKKMFFLLVCLSPLGSSVSIESLMRFGMGLNLFEHVNKLSEAMKQAVTWANELMLSSMLLEGDVEGDVKIHDIIRDFSISCAAKEEEHRFMVEGIPRWLDDETLKKYTAMSLTSKSDYSRLSGVEACKLQILILKGDMSPNFDDFFFDGMVNLVVLALSNMNFQPSLPESMRKLKKLKTLSMEACKLANIELVGELVNLLVLSLRESCVENLASEVGNLCKLRLLDLSGCTSSKLPLIPSGVLSKLSRLEGLYLYNNKQSVFETKSDCEEANAIENNRLPCLNALEIEVAITEDIPIDFQYIEILDKFRISVGDALDISWAALEKCCCILNLGSIKDVSGFLKRSCLRVLPKKVDSLQMWRCNDFEGLVPQLDEEGFRNLRSLSISACDDIKCIVDGRVMNNVVVFPCLQSLDLSCLDSLETVYIGDISPGTFSNLQTIGLNSLDKLLPYALPLVPRNVNKILVNGCELLKFMFTEDEVLPIELRFLKEVQLRNVPCLLSLVGPKTSSDTYETSQGAQIFFDAKIILPSLELFVLDSANYVVKLWSNEIYTPGFQNLKNIKISNCAKLSSFGSPSVLTILVQLETLLISSCDEMCEIISLEEIEEIQIAEQMIRFPRLKYLKLEYLSNLESFYRGGSKLEFPKLEKLILDKLESMKMFVKLENSSALFHEKIDFPCLDELRVTRVNDEVMGLWDKQPLMMKLNPAPVLRQLKLGSSAGLRLIPSIVLENLSSLKLTHFQDDRAVFSSSELGENGGFVWKYSQLPNLEELEVESCESLIELFEKQEEDCHAIDDALLLFCGQVKTLELNKLPSLNLIPLHLFKSVTSRTLYELKWTYLISAHVLEDSLLQLQFLSIQSCCDMEALFINVDSQINLPKLKQLYLWYLDSFTGISATPKKEASLLLPSLESLEIFYCSNLEHFWSGSLIAPKLQDVSLYECCNLQQFLVGNVEDTIQLPCLQKLSFQCCPKINSISSGSLTTPKLREVKLSGCSNMQCFLPANPNYDGDLQLPSLEIVEIYDCPNLCTFSLRPVVAPKVTQIRHNGKECSMLPYDDLNHFLQKMNATSDSKDQEDPDKDDEGLNED